MKININSKEMKVDISMVQACHKIRKLAKLDKVELDATVSSGGLNQHLLSYLDYCGIHELDFVKEYLSNLQPYMLEARTNKEGERVFLCVIDNLYWMVVAITIDDNQCEKLVVSFQEASKCGITKKHVTARELPMYLPVFADCITGRVHNTNNVSIKVFVQRGMMVLPIDIPGYMYQDIFIIYRKYVENAFVENGNRYLRDLYTSDLKLNFEEIDIFSALHQLNFTAYGRDTFTTVSLLVDSLHIQNHYITRRVADFALLTFLKQLRLTVAQKEELIDLLKTRYSEAAYKEMDVVIQRIVDYLTRIES